METASILVKLILVITVFVDAGLFIFILLKGKLDLLHKLILIHLVGILGWALSILLLLQYEHIIYAKLAFLTPLILATAKFLFILAFPENNLPQRSFQYWLVIPLSLAIVFSFFGDAFFKDVTVIDGYYILAENGTYSILYFLTISYLLIAPIFILFKKYQSKIYKGLIKKQIKYLLFGMTVFFAVGLTTNSILPVLFDIYFFNGIGPSFSLILAGFIIYIITKHHFLELRVLIQLGFIYTVILTGIVLSYLTIIYILGIFFSNITNTTFLISSLITTILGILSVPYIDKRLKHLTDRHFFKDKYDYAQAIHTLCEVINKNILLDAIIINTKTTLRQIFKTDEVTIEISEEVLLSERAEVESTDTNYITLSIPIVLDNKKLGSLSLGEKKSGDMYTNEDISLLKSFSSQIAVAFEKAKLYQEVQEYSRELEEKVEERTSEITKLQEQQTHMMLDISHKLQTPLTIVKGELHLLKKRVPDNQGFVVFEQTIDDISTFIYSLLRLARLEIKQTESTSSKCDLTSLLSNLTEYFDTMIKNESITLTQNIENNVFIYAEKEEISELITNLLSNAVKYLGPKTKDKRRDITISLRKINQYAEFSITDTGTGIEENDLANIFSRFYRIKNEQNSNIKGTGLGLAICKKIVDKYGGSVTVESKVNIGTKFTLSFPLLDSTLIN
jgi:signal transduction histidine kinase